jgi:hypothetical protein
MKCQKCDTEHGFRDECPQIFNRADFGEGKIIADLRAENESLKKKVERLKKVINLAQNYIEKHRCCGFDGIETDCKAAKSLKQALKELEATNV